MMRSQFAAICRFDALKIGTGVDVAIIAVGLSGRRLGLTEDDRMRVANDTLRELRRHGEWRELDDTVDSGPTVAQSAKRSETN